MNLPSLYSGGWYRHGETWESSFSPSGKKKNGVLFEGNCSTRAKVTISAHLWKKSEWVQLFSRFLLYFLGKMK